MPPVIDAKDLYKCYPGFAPVLKGASIEVEAGEMAAIMGPSGCGKSTMLHILGMLHAPDSGSLTILDTDVLTLGREQIAEFRRENMGFVMQASNLFEHSTVFENVEFPLIYDNVPPQERWERVIRALDLVHLSKRVHYRSNQLSGGEQQRVAIARAMVNNPRILLADEPTGALDAKTSRLIMENFRNLCHEGGVSMIMVTHDPKMADYCDSIYTLEDGQLRCKKHEPSPFSSKSDISFLKAPEPVLRGALVAASFPTAKDQGCGRLAARLYGAELLSHIYSLRGEGLGGGEANYSLPLSVRHMSFWQRFKANLAFLSHARGSSSLWSLWRKIPSSAKCGFWHKIEAFACGSLLAQWGIKDNTEFYYAASATKSALAAWVCAQLLKRPFAFSVDAATLPSFSAVWQSLVNDAAFVSCSDQSVLNALERQVPKAPKDKFLLLRPIPPILPDEDEEEPQTRQDHDKKLEILCMGPDTSQHGFQLALETAKKLEDLKLDFHLTVLGKATWRQRSLGRTKNLKDKITFYQSNLESGIAEQYREANIFLAYPPCYLGAELALPDYICSALAFGLCVIATDMTPGMAEILETDKNSILVPSAKSEDLAARISSLAQAPQEMQRLAKAARESFKNLMNFSGQMRALADRAVMAAALDEGQTKSGIKSAGKP